MSLISNSQQVLILVELTSIDPTNSENRKINIDVFAFSMKLKNVQTSENKFIVSTDITSSGISQMSQLPHIEDLQNGIYIMVQDKTNNKIYNSLVENIYLIFKEFKNTIYDIETNPKSVKLINNTKNIPYNIYRFTKLPDTTQNIKDKIFVYGIKNLVELIIISTSPSKDINLKLCTGFTNNSEAIYEQCSINNSTVGTF